MTRRKTGDEQRDDRLKPVTAKEIAERLGLSAMTVSRVMNGRQNVGEDTRQRVVQTAREMGYSPNQIAKSLVLRKTRTIGVVVPEISHSFFPEAIRGIEEATSREQYHLILTHSAESAEKEREALLLLESKRVDGILISTAESVEGSSQYRELIGRGVPLVFFDRCVHGIGASCVSIDDEESACRITAHLIGHGYQLIAHLSGPQRISIGRARLAGFKRALLEAGLAVHDELIVESGFHESGGYAGTNQLLDLPRARRPRAIVAVNDPAAFGAITAIRERGLRIPEDIALVGFSDDIRSALLPVPLATIRQPAYDVGRKAAEKLIAAIEGTSPSVEDIVVPAEEIRRRSCGCLTGDSEVSEQSEPASRSVRRGKPAASVQRKSQSI